MSEYQLTSEATEPPMEWEVLSVDGDGDEAYYLAWGHHAADEFLSALETKFKGYGYDPFSDDDKHAGPDDVKHGFWCVAGKDEGGDDTYIECPESDPCARAATWVFIQE